MHHLWLIPTIPLAGAAINGLFGRRLPKSVINIVAIGSVLLSFLWVLKVLSGLGMFGHEAPTPVTTRSITALSRSTARSNPMFNEPD